MADQAKVMRRFAVSPIDSVSGIQKAVKYLITRWYEVSDDHPFGAFHITVDDSDCYCLTHGGCAFLHGKNWTIIEEKEKVA